MDTKPGRILFKIERGCSTYTLQDLMKYSSSKIDTTQHQLGTCMGNTVLHHCIRYIDSHHAFLIPLNCSHQKARQAVILFWTSRRFCDDFLSRAYILFQVVQCHYEGRSSHRKTN